MKENDLIELGFEKQMGDDFYYYTLDITDGFGFITQDSDDAKDNGWQVEIFDTADVISFNCKDELRTVIDILRKNVVKPEQI